LEKVSLETDEYGLEHPQTTAAKPIVNAMIKIDKSFFIDRESPIKLNF
jgi:hypothetical protein